MGAGDGLIEEGRVPPGIRYRRGSTLNRLIPATTEDSAVIDLTDILPVEAIRVEASASDWPAAIRAAGELLVATGTATPEYAEVMIDNVRRNGPHIVVAPGTGETVAAPGKENASTSSRGRIPRPAGAPLPPSRHDLGL